MRRPAGPSRLCEAGGEKLGKVTKDPLLHKPDRPSLLSAFETEEEEVRITSGTDTQR